MKSKKYKDSKQKKFQKLYSRVYQRMKRCAYVPGDEIENRVEHYINILQQAASIKEDIMQLL